MSIRPIPVKRGERVKECGVVMNTEMTWQVPIGPNRLIFRITLTANHFPSQFTCLFEITSVGPTFLPPRWKVHPLLSTSSSSSNSLLHTQSSSPQKSNMEMKQKKQQHGINHLLWEHIHTYIDSQFNFTAKKSGHQQQYSTYRTSSYNTIILLN